MWSPFCTSLAWLLPTYYLFWWRNYLIENIVWFYLNGNSRNTDFIQFTNTAWMSGCLVTLVFAFSSGQFISCKWGSVSISILNLIFRGYNLAVVHFLSTILAKWCKFYFCKAFTLVSFSFSISDIIYVALDLLNQLN